MSDLLTSILSFDQRTGPKYLMLCLPKFTVLNLGTIKSAFLRAYKPDELRLKRSLAIHRVPAATLSSPQAKLVTSLHNDKSYITVQHQNLIYMILCTCRTDAEVKSDDSVNEHRRSVDKTHHCCRTFPIIL